jgi:hypothetical protein
MTTPTIELSKTNTVEMATTSQNLPATVDKASSLVLVLQSWRPSPTQMALVIERCCDRIATDATIAERCGKSRGWLSEMRRDKTSTFARVYDSAMYDEETAVLVLAYYANRGALATLYRAVNGRPVQRAQVIAAQAVIDTATRRQRQREYDPLPALM